MEEQRKKEAAATIVGFGLAKAATSLGYLSAMGSVGQSVGFVTELWFMFAASAVFAQAGVALEMAPLLGVLYGIGQTVVSIAWLDIFSMQESERSHICMVCGLVLQAFIVAGSFCFGYGLAFDLIVCAMAACSLVCYRVSVALAHEPARTSALGDHGTGNAQVRRYLSDAFCSPLGLTTGACSRSLAWWAFCIRRFWGRLPSISSATFPWRRPCSRRLR